MSCSSVPRTGMFQSLLQHTDNGTTVCSVRLVYLSGLAAETDADVLRQLASLPGHPHVVTASSVPEALAELRKTVEDFHALVMSPALSEADTIEAIAAVREREPSVTVLPIVYDYNQHDYVSSGASDVLVLANGLLVDPVEIMARVASVSDPAEASDPQGNGSAGKKKKKASRGFRSLFQSARGRAREDALAEQEESDRELLKNRLNRLAERTQVEPSKSADPVREPDPEPPPPSPPNGSDQSPFLELNLSDRQRPADRAPAPSLLSIFSAQSEGEPAAQDLSLAETRAALQKATETLLAERAAWSTIRQELDAATAAAQAEVRTAVNLHAADAEAHLKELRVATDAQQKVEAALGQAEAERQAASDALAAERADWATTRQTLEAAVQAAQADLKKALNEEATSENARTIELREAGEARARLEASLAQAQAEGRQAAEAIETERTAWNTIRQQLEATARNAQADLKKAMALHADLDARTKELQESTEARVKLEAALGEVQQEQLRITTTIGAERAAWNAVRQELEEAVQTARSKVRTAEQTASVLDARTKELQEATAARAQAEAALVEAQADRRKAGEAAEADRASWSAVRQQLEAAATSARAELHQAAAAYAAEVEAQAKAVREAREAQSKAEAALETIQVDGQKATETHRADEAAWNTSRRQLESALTEARQQLAAAEPAQAQLAIRSKELGEATAAHAKVGAALAESQAERRRANDAFVAERAAWDAMRQHLEAAVHDARSKAKSADEATTELNSRMKDLRESLEARAKLEAALAESQAGRQRADEAYDTERAAWNVARAQLQTAVEEARAQLLAAQHSSADLELRTQELRTSAEARAKLEASLAEAEAGRHKADAGIAAERTAWDTERRRLEGETQDARAKLLAMERTIHELQAHTKELQEALDARAAIEARLTETQAERQKERDAFGAERASWHTTRQQLDGALKDAQAKLEGTGHAAHDLEARTKELREAVEARTGLEVRLAETQTEQQRDRDAFGAERASWHTTRQQLEAALDGARSKLETSEHTARELDARTNDLQAATEARSRVEAELAKAKAEHHKTHETFKAERAAWDVARHEHERAIHEARTQLTAAEHLAAEVESRTKELHASTEARARIDKELAHARTEHEKSRHALDAERTAWNATRQGLESSIHETRSQLDRALADLQTERRQTREAVEAERSTWAAARRQFEAEAGAAQNDLKETIRLKASELEARRGELRASADARAKLEVALGQAEAEQRQMQQAFEAEQAAWQTIRQGLETAATSSQAELKKAVARHGAEHALLTKELHETAQQRGAAEGALKKAEAEIQDTGARHAEAAAAWQATRAELERRVAEQGTAVREELQAELASVRAELAHQTETFGAQRTDWHVTRRLLEARLSELQAAAEARDKLEEALMGARTELQEAIDAHAAERTSWEELRRHPREGKAGDKRKGGSAAADKDDEILDAYRALEARVRETTDRLHLVRGGTGKWLLGAEGGYDTREELAHSERMHAQRVEEVAKLAIAMTPDITELVASIEDFGSRLSQHLDPAAAEQHDAQAILQRSKEAGDLLRQLAAFMEKHSQPVIALNLAEAIREAEPMLTWIVGSHIDFRTHLEATALVNVDSDDFQRMLTALVISARDLLTAGGSVVVETALPQVADKDTRETSAGSDQEASSPILTVTASGYGVRPPFLSPELDLLVRECGGRGSVTATPNGGSSLEVVFGHPRQQSADSVRHPDTPTIKLRSAG